MISGDLDRSKFSRDADLADINHSLLRCEVAACVAIASSKPFSNQVAVVGTQGEPRYDCSNRLHGNHRNGCGLIVEVSAETT